MRVVLIGSGGREHALAQKISESYELEKLMIIPGNPGTKEYGENINLDIADTKIIVNYCKEQKIDLVVVGPEKPLIEGLADELIENGLKVFGPTKQAAEIEGGKAFAKRLMKEYNIPTASFEVFDKYNYEDALKYLHATNYPTVIKADGIAAGKGVIIAETFEDAKEALKEFFINSSFGTAGDKIVIEEFMTGQEASVFAITDGTNFVILPPAQDHKRIYDGDKGKNTGGMGAYAPTPFVNDTELNIIAEKIIYPTLQALREKNSPFVGCLYCGLMMTNSGPKVVEFNCRFGDPETQAVLPLLKGDLLNLLYSAACDKIDRKSVQYNGGSSVCIVAASGGYPDNYEKGFEIIGLNQFIPNVKIYHAGTTLKNNAIITNGGRVLNISSFIEENNLSRAKQIAYDAISKINFEGIHYRKDIADKAIHQNK